MRIEERVNCFFLPQVSYVLWHPCAKSVLLSAGFDCKIIIWNTETGDKLSEIPDLTGKEQQIYSVSWNYDGSYFATSCKDKKLRIVDPRSGEVKMVCPCVCVCVWGGGGGCYYRVWVTPVN